jgi:tetratricopeptide (TPR) repeat protein
MRESGHDHLTKEREGSVRIRIGLFLLALVATAGWTAGQSELTPEVRRTMLQGIIRDNADWTKDEVNTPLNLKEVEYLLKGKDGPQRTAEKIDKRGVDFEMTPEIEKKFRKAKVDDALIELVKNYGPTARAARGLAFMPSPAETLAFHAIKSELVPEKTLQLVGEFVQTYPKSSYLSLAYMLGAIACGRKGDVTQVIVYLDKSLEANPGNILSLVMKASLLPQPQMLKGGADAKIKQLAEAEEKANKALTLIARISRNYQETDAMLAKRKATLGAGAHSALGAIHLQRAQMSQDGANKAEVATAEQEYRISVTSADNPAPEDYYGLGETLVIQNKLPQALAAFTKASEAGAGMALKGFADQRIEDLRKKNPQLQPAAQP